MTKTRLVEHLVRAGECVASIAAGARTSLEALWTLPENAELRQTRDDPYVLAPGDRVQIPVAQGQRHTANRPGIAAGCEQWRPFRTRAHRQRGRVVADAEGPSRIP